MKILASRFPEYWGPNALNIWDELGISERKGNEPSLGGRVQRMSTEELDARLEDIQRQRLAEAEAESRADTGDVAT